MIPLEKEEMKFVVEARRLNIGDKSYFAFSTPLSKLYL